MKITLHLGVHKTATTYIQSRLSNSKDTLAANGIFYLGLNDTRRLITSKLDKDLTLDPELTSQISGCERFILSDENFIGGTNKLRNNRLYPNVAHRLRNLIESLNNENIDIYLTIRDPESYMVSRYIEYLRHFSFLSFNEYYDEFFIRNFSWKPLVRLIEKVSGKSIKVQCFESIFNREDEYFEKLIGIPDIVLEKADSNQSIKRAKVSRESYEILEHLAQHYPRRMTKKILNMMDNNVQISKQNSITPFSPALSLRLKENYKMDITTLCTE
ncbi:hypothetical protein [Desulfosediminicola flagellatus]|uniref:hypothetical protein n=1 Tax=Desulfosediminicola flagellatus TaxID=2569541 RepID=UPI0010ACA0EA|nr:hypothetical protein [Desulfosediminicola flagellatus]